MAPALVGPQEFSTALPLHLEQSGRDLGSEIVLLLHYLGWLLPRICHSAIMLHAATRRVVQMLMLTQLMALTTVAPSQACQQSLCPALLILSLADTAPPVWQGEEEDPRHDSDLDDMEQDDTLPEASLQADGEPPAAMPVVAGRTRQASVKTATTRLTKAKDKQHQAEAALTDILTEGDMLQTIDAAFTAKLAKAKTKFEVTWAAGVLLRNMPLLCMGQMVTLSSGAGIQDHGHRMRAQARRSEELCRRQGSPGEREKGQATLGVRSHEAPHR